MIIYKTSNSAAVCAKTARVIAAPKNEYGWEPEGTAPINGSRRESEDTAAGDIVVVVFGPVGGEESGGRLGGGGESSGGLSGDEVLGGGGGGLGGHGAIGVIHGGSQGPSSVKSVQ